MGKGSGKGNGGGGIFGMIENFFEGALECVRCVICCLCCWLISIPVLFIIGIVFIVTPSHRKAYVQQYNDAVDNWVSEGYSQFNAENNHLSLYLGGIGTSLLQSTSSDSLNDHGSDIKTYTKYLKYYTNYNPSWGSSNPQFPSGDTRNPSLQANAPTATTLTLPSRPATTSPIVSVSGNTTTQRQNSCNSIGGIWDYPNCLMPYSLKSVCTIVDLSVASIAVSSQYSGCWVNSRGFNSRSQDPTTTSGVTAAIYNSPQPGNPTTLSVYVRSSADPFVVALSITNGSLDFGLSTAQKLLIGFILIGISGCLALPFVCVCYAFCRNRDRRGKYYAKFRGQEYQPMYDNGNVNNGGYNQGGYQQYNNPPQQQYNQPPQYNAPQYNPGYQPQQGYQPQPGYPQQGGFQQPGYPGYP